MASWVSHDTSEPSLELDAVSYRLASLGEDEAKRRGEGLEEELKAGGSRSSVVCCLVSDKTASISCWTISSRPRNSAYEGTGGVARDEC